MAAISWLALTLSLRELQGEAWHAVGIDLSLELFKAIVIGVCVGTGVEVYMKLTERREEKGKLERTLMTMLEQAQVKSVHPARVDCVGAFKKYVEDPNVRSISIVGISLREFLRPDGRMRPVWTAITQRLQREEIARLVANDRLNVKLLMLDPKSEEGLFRFKIEEQIETDSDSTRDVEQSINEIRRVQRSIFSNQTQKILRARLYGHCPFSFMFLTNRALFVQQYYYREQEDDLSTPVVEYAYPGPRHDLFRRSFNIIWRKAHEEYIRVGTALPIDRAHIKNIFRADQRAELSERQVQSIGAVQSGTIDILAVSGRYYVTSVDTSGALLSISRRQQHPVTIRIGILNPVSQQAIMRAVADDRPIGDIREALCQWDWNKHASSRLYQDINQTISRISDWRTRGHHFEGRVYSSSVTCALLITPTEMFVEQYIYGRTKKLQESYLLIGEYPVIEYDCSHANHLEHEIISSNFEIIWSCYSLSFDDFRQRNQREDFEKNLSTLLSELECGTSPTE